MRASGWGELLATCRFQRSLSLEGKHFFIVSNLTEISYVRQKLRESRIKQATAQQRLLDN